MSEISELVATVRQAVIAINALNKIVGGIALPTPVAIAAGGTGATTAAAARTNLGSTAVGDALFIAATAAAARTTLGSGATGDALFLAATAVVARTALLGFDPVAADANKMLMAMGAGSYALTGPARAYGKNAIDNPDGRIAQRSMPLLIGGVFLFGADRWTVAPTGAVTAGTLFAGSNNNGFDLGLYFGSSISSTGANTLYWRQRIEAAQAQRFSTFYNANRRASFQFKLGADVAAGQSVSVTFNKANAADNFSAVTTISTTALAVTSSAALSVPNVYTIPNLNLGACENGLEIWIFVSVPAGASGKTYGIGDVQLEEGPLCTDLAKPIPALELIRCYRRHYEYNWDGVTSAIFAAGTAVSTSVCTALFSYPVEMASPPAVSVSAVGDFTVTDGSVNNAATAVALSGSYNSTRRHSIVAFTTAATLTAFRPCSVFGTTASGAVPRLKFDCEL